MNNLKTLYQYELKKLSSVKSYGSRWLSVLSGLCLVLHHRCLARTM